MPSSLKNSSLELRALAYGRDGLCLTHHCIPRSKHGVWDMAGWKNVSLGVGGEALRTLSDMTTFSTTTSFCKITKWWQVGNGGGGDMQLVEENTNCEKSHPIVTVVLITINCRKSTT